MKKVTLYIEEETLQEIKETLITHETQSIFIRDAIKAEIDKRKQKESKRIESKRIESPMEYELRVNDYLRKRGEEMDKQMQRYPK